MRRFGAVVFVTAALFSQTAFALLSVKVTGTQLHQAIQVAVNQSKNSYEIAMAALDAGVDARSLTTAMLHSGFDSGAAISTVHATGDNPWAVQSSTLAAGVSQAVMSTVVNIAGLTLFPLGPVAGSGSSGSGYTGSPSGPSGPSGSGGGTVSTR